MSIANLRSHEFVKAQILRDVETLIDCGAPEESLKRLNELRTELDCIAAVLQDDSRKARETG